MPTLYNLHVAFGLHWYQPYTQKREILKDIAENSYASILNSIEKNCIGTVNCDIAASLIFQLADTAPEVLEKIVRLKNRGKISLVNTAAHHPILPLVPPEYAKRQLEQNKKAYLEHGLISAKEKLSGVFPPEMAYGDILTTTLAKMRYSWTVTDDMPFCKSRNGTPAPATYLVSAGGVACLMRSRKWCKEMSFDKPNGGEFAEKLCREFPKQFKDNVYQAYIVLWTDAETFGVHHKSAVGHFLTPFFTAVKKLPMNLESCESLPRLYPTKKIVVPAGSWSSNASDIETAPYNIWKYPKNEWTILWWKLADIILKIDSEYPESRELTGKVLYSCQTWWWSLYKNKDLFLLALPDLKKALQFGNQEERKTGDDLISRLSDY